jgi:hypothetical protein
MIIARKVASKSAGLVSRDDGPVVLVVVPGDIVLSKQV